jgi:hypothetical protein
VIQKKKEGGREIRLYRWSSEGGGLSDNSD